MAGSLHAVPALGAVVPGVARATGVRLRVKADGVALTFDDGPGEGTPAVLAALAAAGATATFFLVGEQVRRRPELAREIVAEGHVIALHGERHRNHLRLSPGAVRDDVRRGAATIAETCGVVPALYRPPYGILSSASRVVLAQEGWRVLLWSRWGRDWTRRATSDSITRRAARDLGPGEVVLLHDADEYSAPGSWRATAAAVPRVLDAIGARGLPTVRTV